MSATLFTTDRLVVRRWNGTELTDLLAVYGDADAMRWVGDGVAITREPCEKWIEVTLGNYAKRGYGMFALEEAGSGQVVGFAGLVHPVGNPPASQALSLALTITTAAAARILAWPTMTWIVPT